MSVEYPRAVPCGDCGLSIEFGDLIDEDINARVISLDRRLAELRPAGVIETVPTYRALMIHYDPLETSFDLLARETLALARDRAGSTRRGRHLCIPICYEGELGADIDDVARRLGLAREEVIARHSAALYRVYMLGFQPGFAYLGGLDPSLSLPRRPEPRFGARAGTISIAAGQCAVHGVEGPSGWHWIGRTPVGLYEPGDPPRCAIEPGDTIRFLRISEADFHMRARVIANSADLIEVDA